ncbi:DUF4342 domain-containing protein [Inediibacterium massiliense]|uniref:DUF4342 domain-containing protein n=1 Tax=Inediibacterium massiliense TaxID=1658111 RepID=UPI0006B59918|nr:DUF4342 domain-containing protein [Inediibacterium massiliense]
MEITLEQIDQVRDRTGVSYKEAREALEVAGGNVIDAIILIEEKQSKNFKENISGVGNDIVEKLKEIVKKGNITKIVFKKDGEVMMNIPVTAGAVGAFLAPQIAMIGTLAALATKCKIEIVKTDGEVVDLNEMAEGALDNMKNTAEDTFEQIKSKMSVNKNKVDLNKDEAVDIEKKEEE